MGCVNCVNSCMLMGVMSLWVTGHTLHTIELFDCAEGMRAGVTKEGPCCLLHLRNDPSRSGVAQGMHSVAWHEADMLTLPFADATFDAVCSHTGPSGVLCNGAGARDA